MDSEFCRHNWRTFVAGTSKMPSYKSLNLNEIEIFYCQVLLAAKKNIDLIEANRATLSSDTAKKYERDLARTLLVKCRDKEERLTRVLQHFEQLYKDKGGKGTLGQLGMLIGFAVTAAAFCISGFSKQRGEAS